MEINRSAIACLMARARGRPRIGAERCNVTLPDRTAQAIDERRRLTGEARNQAIIALIDVAVARSPHFIDRQGAVALLRSSINMRLKNTDDKVAKKIALNALAALDGIEEYLGLVEEEMKSNG